MMCSPYRRILLSTPWLAVWWLIVQSYCHLSQKICGGPTIKVIKLLGPTLPPALVVRCWLRHRFCWLCIVLEYWLWCPIFGHEKGSYRPLFPFMQMGHNRPIKKTLLNAQRTLPPGRKVINVWAIRFAGDFVCKPAWSIFTARWIYISTAQWEYFHLEVETFPPRGGNVFTARWKCFQCFQFGFSIF